MAEFGIRGREDGPYMVTGLVRSVDAEGQQQSKAGKSVSLCRCGGSCKKPLCDGTHRRIEFRAPAVEITVVEQGED